MSIDPNKFGLTPSLIEMVKEALKGNQHKLDVAEPKGKLTAADFKKLRGEDAKPDYLDFDKDGNKKEPMKKALRDKEMKEVADGNSKNFKANMKEGPEEKDVTNPKQGSSVDPKQRSIGEAAAVGAPSAGMGIANQMTDRKQEIQRKIAQKQAMHQQSKAKKRIAGTMKEGDKCTCGETKESKMACETHGGKHDEKGKGGREAIVVNPPLKEASDLPKKVVTKGHEIAKSLIKHRAKVKSPYAVGMAAAKKSAGIKEETVDESVYPERHAAAKKIIGDLAKKKGGKVGFQSTSFKDGKKVTVHGYHDEKGERHVTHTTTED